ncbi:MAG TPA: preprotein translocase subunit SecE [Candidatus Sulfotelmatobacter sp.]|nr:preprotein translocase subunit SecE [Candidatus Sulfotelmatobacter sp.]
MQRIRRYIEESWSELKKVTWPTPRQTWNLTVLVFVVSAMVGVFIFGVDAVFTTGLKIVTSL